MNKIATRFFLGLLFSSLVICCQNKEEETEIILRNDKVRLVQNRNGGAFTAFQLTDKKINPFEWILKVKDQPEINRNGFDFQGHFICLGTWGLPTVGEQKSGIRLYGEPTARKWNVESEKRDKRGNDIGVTSFKSEIEGLSLKRTVKLHSDEPLVYVTEVVTNDQPIGRMYNFLQHPTFGGAFVSESLRIDTNAGLGFYQKGNFPRVSYEDLESTSFLWPNGALPKDTIDLRKTGEIPNTFLTSHVFSKDKKIAWVTATNMEEKIMVGYIWKTEEYPWLNVWHQYKDGKVAGRAIEFATCGLGLSFEELLSQDYSFYGENSFEFIDAKQTISKSYYMFSITIPSNFIQVNRIDMSNNQIQINYSTDQKPYERNFSIDSF